MSFFELGVGLSVVGWGGWGSGVADYLRWVCEFYGRGWEVVPSWLGVGLSVVSWSGWGSGVAGYLRWVCEFYEREWEVVPSFWVGVGLGVADEGR